jgi:segregation and condensation protein A
VTYLVDIEAFHGPLDLLLFLIEKNELDIYDIPIAFITDQYLQYLQTTGEFDLEKMGEFLIMTTYLLNLKSRLLLPRTNPSQSEDEEEQIDPREELVQKLLEYRRYKEAGQQLQQRELGLTERVYYRQAKGEPDRDEVLVVDLAALVRAYRNVMRRLPVPEPEAIIPEGDVNVSDKMMEILEILVQQKGKISFRQLFANISRRREGLALFLALLELIRLQKVKAQQNSPWEDIQLEMW